MVILESPTSHSMQLKRIHQQHLLYFVLTVVANNLIVTVASNDCLMVGLPCVNDLCAILVHLDQTAFKFLLILSKHSGPCCQSIDDINATEVNPLVSISTEFFIAGLYLLEAVKSNDLIVVMRYWINAGSSF